MAIFHILSSFEFNLKIYAQNFLISIENKLRTKYCYGLNQHTKQSYLLINKTIHQESKKMEQYQFVLKLIGLKTHE